MVRFEEKSDREDSYAHQLSDRTYMSARQTYNSINDMKMYDGHGDGSAYVGRFLTICPSEELVIPNSQRSDSKGIIILVNTGNKNIAFKVKTNVPDKYRVRPCTGVVKPGEEIDITVTVHPEFKNLPQAMEDKFLVMAMEINRDHLTAADLQDLWKNSPKERIMEHKIRCNLGSKSLADSPRDVDLLNRKLDSVMAKCTDLQRGQIVSTVLIVLMLVAVVILFVMQWKTN